MSAEEKKEKEEKILREFFKIVPVDTLIANLKPYYKITDICYELDDCYEFLNEYTDTCIRSKKIPDFFLRSRKEELPDLAIEVKTLERHYDRFADYNKSLEIKDYKLTIRDLEFVINLDLPGFILPPPKEVVKLWGEFENELKKFERRLECIVDTINIIEEKLGDENQDMYLKDLSHEQKEELSKVIYDIKQRDREFVEYTDFIYTLSYFEIHLGIDEDVSGLGVGDVDKIRSVREIIKRDKRRFLNQHVKNFLEDYFNEKACKNSSSNCIARVRLKEQGNQFIFTVHFIKTWKSEDIDFHINEIEKFIRESKKKFENLRKIKSDKLNNKFHLELLLVEATSFAIETFEDHVKELYEKLMQRGYNYPFYSVKNPDNPLSLSKFYLICMNDEMKPIDKEIK